MTVQLDLSLKDIKFLRAIRDINESPDRFASTEGGAVPATVTAITKATTLTKDEVNYRLNHRGLEDAGFIAVHKAELKENGSFGPKSAEITDEGVEELRAAQQRQGLVETDADGSVLEPAQGAGDDRVAELEARIEQLESTGRSEPNADVERRLDEIAEEVADLREATDRLESTVSTVAEGLDAIQKDDYGALSEKREEQLRGAVKSMVAFYQIAESVLDVDVEAFEPAAGRADARKVKQTRRAIADALDVGGQAAPGGLVQPEQVGTGVDASASSGGTDLSTGGDWPDPGESGGRVFNGKDDVDETASTDSEPAAEPAADADAEDEATTAVDTEADDDREGEADTSVETADDAAEPESAADTQSGIYPPIGSNRDEDGETADASTDESDTDGTAAADEADADASVSEANAEAVDPSAVAAAAESARTVADGDDADDSSPESAADAQGGIYPPLGSNRDDAAEADDDTSATDGDEEADTSDTASESDVDDGTAGDDGIDREAYARVVDVEPPVEIVDARAKADEREQPGAADAAPDGEADAEPAETTDAEPVAEDDEARETSEPRRDATARIVDEEPAADVAADAAADVTDDESSGDETAESDGEADDEQDDVDSTDLLSAVANPDNSLASDD